MEKKGEYDDLPELFANADNAKPIWSVLGLTEEEYYTKYHTKPVWEYLNMTEEEYFTSKNVETTMSPHTVFDVPLESNESV